MILYFAKHPTFDLVGTASTEQTESIRLSDNGSQKGEYRSVSGGYRSYGATVYFQPDQSTHVKEMTAPGNYILYKDRNGESVWLTIRTCEHDPLAGYDTITAEDASMDLINETVDAYTAPKAMTAAEYINLFVTDSGFEIGVNEIPTLTRTLKWESEEVTALNRILSVAIQFDVELSFRFEIDGLTAVKKYIDLRKHIGRDRRTELTVDSQLNNLVTSTDVDELYTSVYATGATPEGANQPISLKGYSWTDPDGRFVLKSDGSLRDPVANQSWSRLPAKDSLTSGFINRVKTYEAQTQATLLQSALSDLKQHNHPAVTYTVDIAVLPDDIQVGDTVHLRDEKEQLFLTARVLELTYSYSTESGTATLGDYLIEASEVDPAYRALAEELAKQNKGKDGVGLKASVVTYQAGTSGTVAPTGEWADTVPEVAPSQFLWSRTVLNMTDGSSSTTYSVGKIGDTGKPGNGIQSSIVTYQVGTSGTTAPTGTWSSTVPTVSQGAYLWSRIITTYTDGTQNTAYSVAYQAKDGADGKPGSQDVPMTYVQVTQPTGKIVTDSTWWVGDSMKTATALKRWNGSDWVPDTIAQAVLNIIELNAVTINAGTLNSPDINVPFSHAVIDTDGPTYGSGKMTFSGAAFAIDGTTDDIGQKFHLGFSPSGFSSEIYDADGHLQNLASMIKGQLDLYYGSGDAVNGGSIDGLLAEQLNNVGRVLWSGKTQLGDNQSITPSLPLSKCLNGWKLGLAIGGGNRFFWYYLSKERALESPNLGHLVPIFDFNVGGGGQYYYVSDTKLTGNSSVNLNNSVGSAYYIYEIRAF
ncbi:phage tail spike protein [Lacticaseibacillus salsurivasis]|uniref:phage tail spike protein n=1 Tax=Lacticaseibacillus salsurivasis TaxID=3081441 RepID=UPI0030C71D40